MVVESLKKRGFFINLRLAGQRDARRVFRLNNDPIVRQNAIHVKEIKWKDHVKWFSRTLSDKGTKFFVAESDTGNFVGEVRFKRQHDGWVVTIHIADEFRGRHISSELLAFAMGCTRIRRFVAYVKPGNLPSIRLFESAGYLSTGSIAIPVDGGNVLLCRYLFER